jgi:hypothetical protein
MAVTAALSPSSFPQSSTGRFEVRHSTGALIAAHHDLQQILGGGHRQLAHAEIVDDEQRHRSQQFHVLFAGSIDGRFRQVIEQFVGFAIKHAIALLNGGLSDGLGKMAFPGAGWTKKQGIVVLGDEETAPFE